MKPVSAPTAPDTPPTPRPYLPDTSHQIGALLSIVGAAGNFLISGESLRSRDEHEETARAEALKTFELANLQLRNIVDEQERWTIQHPDEVEEMELQMADARLGMLREMRRPSLVMSAKVRFVEALGKWVAWVGDLVDGTLHGSGNTPAEALAAFDVVYSKGFSNQTASAPAAEAPEDKK